jgi:DNA polymerase I-like protein with 3'-5' exonuclease and polymerase domains
MRSFEYKLLNYLVQGSSADMTKEAVLRYDAMGGESQLLLTVHDEIVINAPKKIWRAEMVKLKNAMESIEIDVPLLSDGERGYRWTEMKECL